MLRAIQGSPGSQQLVSAGNARIEHYHQSGVLCWSGNDDEAHAGRHQHNAQVRGSGARGLLHTEDCRVCVNTHPPHFKLLYWCFRTFLQGVISVTSNLIPGLFSKLMTQVSKCSLQSACAYGSSGV